MALLLGHFSQAAWTDLDPFGLESFNLSLASVDFLVLDCFTLLPAMWGGLFIPWRDLSWFTPKGVDSLFLNLLGLFFAVRDVRPDEPEANRFLAVVNVLFLSLTCGFCLCDTWTGFSLLFDVLEFEDNWLADLLVSTGGTEVWGWAWDFLVTWVGGDLLRDVLAWELWTGWLLIGSPIAWCCDCWLSLNCRGRKLEGITKCNTQSIIVLYFQFRYRN